MDRAAPRPAEDPELDPRWYAKLFDRLGARYEDFPFAQGFRQEAQFLRSELFLTPGERLLDVGCGPARHAVELAAAGLSVTGVDDVQNRRVLERMRAALRAGGRLALNALNRAYVLANLESFSGFDSASGVTQHTELMTFESGASARVRYQDRAYFTEEIRVLVTEVGFHVDAVYGVAPGDFGRHPPDPARHELLVLATAC